MKGWRWLVDVEHSHLYDQGWLRGCELLSDEWKGDFHFYTERLRRREPWPIEIWDKRENRGGDIELIVTQHANWHRESDREWERKRGRALLSPPLEDDSLISGALCSCFALLNGTCSSIMEQLCIACVNQTHLAFNLCQSHASGRAEKERWNHAASADDNASHCFHRSPWFLCNNQPDVLNVLRAYFESLALSFALSFALSRSSTRDTWSHSQL